MKMEILQLLHAWLEKKENLVARNLWRNYEEKRRCMGVANLKV